MGHKPTRERPCRATIVLSLFSRQMDRVSVEYITKHIASVQQRYTQSGGVRPFGISTLLCGFDQDGTPRLFQTDPAGTYSEWKANSTGRSAKTIREFLEKNYKDDCSADDAIKLAVQALMEVVESGSKNIEVAVMRNNAKLEVLPEEQIESVCKVIEAEKAAAAEAAAPSTK